MEYIVKGGDTLWDISARTLGSGHRWRELGYTGDPRKLQIGTRLNVPGTEAPQTAPVETVDEYIDSSQKLGEELTPKVADPIAPFSFDEELAKNAVEAEISPYYDELLSDYMSNVETRKTRATEDERANLGLLGEQDRLYREDLDRDYNIAVEKTRQGFAGRNLYFSGKKTEAEGQIGTEKTAREEAQKLSQDYKVSETEKLGTRTREDIDIAESMYTRDLGRERSDEKLRKVAKRRGEQHEAYDTGDIAAYYGDSGFGFNNTL